MDIKVMKELHLERRFCDAEFIVENVTFPIHKFAIACCSPYFSVVFECWSAPEKQVFPVSVCSAETMNLIIDFVYTNHVLVTDDNVEDLLYAADYFCINGIISACITFLEAKLCPENSISIWRLAGTLSFTGLEHKAYCLLLEHFESVVDSSEFLELSLEELKAIVETDLLCVTQETTVFEAILRWISHSPRERSTHFHVLLTRVRLALLSIQYLRTNVASNALVSSNRQCMEVVRCVERILHTQPRFNSMFARPRLRDAILFATGGMSGGRTTGIIEVYDIRKNCWVDVTNNRVDATNNRVEARAFHGVVFLSGSLYYVGGCDVETFSTMRRFDLSTRIWHTEPFMLFCRSSVSVCVLNGCIYALGGFDGRESLNSAERYDPHNNLWTNIAPMVDQRSDAGCTTLSGKVYICGGYDGFKCHASAEFYDPDTDSWTEITSMRIRRKGLGVVAHGGKIYAVGGFDGAVCLSIAEVYSPDTDNWAPLPSMHIPRSNFGISILGDLIFVAGGVTGLGDESSTTNTVECYNIGTAQWSMISDMHIPRHGLSCCALTEVSNLSEFLGEAQHISRKQAADGRTENSNKGHYLLSSEVNRLYQERHFCDAIIRAQDASFYVHKPVLSICSPYFRSLFSRVSPADKTYKFNVSPEIMQAVIDCCYTGSVSVTHEKVDKLLKGAIKFKMEAMQKACWSFLEAHLSSQNCISIWQGRKYGRELRDKAFTFVVEHFEELANSSAELLQLSCHDLKKILEHDYLQVGKESIVFETILRWIAHSPQDRTRNFAALFATVRLAMLDTEYLVNNVQNNELVMNNPACQIILARARIVLRQSMPVASGFLSPFARKNLTREVLLLTGGPHRHCGCITIHAYDDCARKWVAVDQKSTTQQRKDHGAVFLDGSVYIIGGRTREHTLQTVSRFDLKTHTWHELGFMSKCRAFVSVTVLDGCIYALGGNDGTARLTSAERYDPVTDRWTQIAPMHDARAGAGCTTLDGKIYICGGQLGQRDSLSSAECYDPKTDEWTRIAPMPTKRSGLGVIAYQGCIYAVGGFSDLRCFDILEVYDPAEDSWSQLPSMPTNRSGFGIVIIGNRLFVLGGERPFNHLQFVATECFDFTTRRWSLVPNLKISRFHVRACVVSGLTSAASVPHDDPFLQCLLSSSRDSHSSSTSDNTTVPIGSLVDADTEPSQNVSVNDPTTDHVSDTPVGTKCKPWKWGQNLWSSVFQMITEPLKNIKNVFRTIFHRQSHLSSNSGSVLVTAQSCESSDSDNTTFNHVDTDTGLSGTDSLSDPDSICLADTRDQAQFTAQSCESSDSDHTKFNHVGTDTGLSGTGSLSDPNSKCLADTRDQAQFKPVRIRQTFVSGLLRSSIKPFIKIKNFFCNIFKIK